MIFFRPQMGAQFFALMARGIFFWKFPTLKKSNGASFTVLTESSL